MEGRRKEADVPNSPARGEKKGVLVAQLGLHGDKGGVGAHSGWRLALSSEGGWEELTANTVQDLAGNETSKLALAVTTTEVDEHALGNGHDHGTGDNKGLDNTEAANDESDEEEGNRAGEALEGVNASSALDTPVVLDCLS